MSARSILKKAYVAFQERDYVSAEQHCLSVLDKDPNSYDAYLLLGKCAFISGNLQKADEHYTKATDLNPDGLPAWQGLAELFEDSSTDPQKALLPLQRIEGIMKKGENIDDEKLIQIQLRLSEVLKRLERREEAEKVLQEVLELVKSSEQRLQVLCLLGDLQLMDYEKTIEERVEQAFESLTCSIDDKTECEYDALLNKVTGEYVEEALEANSMIATTLKQIIHLSPPSGQFKKFHDFYLQMFCKAMYCAPPRSTQRYNLRLQALEMCYKMIHGRSSSVQGLCTSSFPFVTALRLLEINDEIVGSRRAVGGQKMEALNSPRGEMKRIPSMFKSESEPALHEISHSPKTSTKSIRISLTSKTSGMESRKHGSLLRRQSLERRPSLDGSRCSFRLNSSPRSSFSSGPSTPHSTLGMMPPLLEGNDSSLPKFMRSSSLSCVRKFHRLDSGILEGAEDIIGGNSPLVAEISNTIGRKLAYLLPWHPESKIQMVLGILRKQKSLKSHSIGDQMTDLGALEMLESPQEMTSIHLGILEKGIRSGSRLLSPRVALVDLLLETKSYQTAVDSCEDALRWIEHQSKEGGYPRTQAALTFQLQKAAAFLKMGRFQEAEQVYQSLTETVSEGEVSIGSLAGCHPVSIHQAAQRGLAQVALAQGNRYLALRRYEQMMGAGIMGKSPIEHWAAAEYGYMLFEDGDTVRAKQYLEKAIEILNGLESNVDLEQIRAEYFFKLAQVYWSLGSKWKTDPQFTRCSLKASVLVPGPYQASAFSLLGQYYKEVEKDNEKAEECWKNALKLDPQQEIAFLSLLQTMKSNGCSLLEQKNFCTRSLTLGCRGSWIFHSQGDLFLEEESYQSAIQSFQRALKTQQENPVLWEKLGTAHLKTRRLTSALKSFSRAVELDPKRLYALLRQGECLFLQEEYKAAIESYRRAFEVDAGSPVVISNLVGCLLASSKTHHRSGLAGLAAKEIFEAEETIKNFAESHWYPKVFSKLEGEVFFWKSCLYSLDFLKEIQKGTDPDNLLLASKAEEERQRQDLNQAVKAYSKTLRLYPNLSSGWGDFASSQMRNKSLDPKLIQRWILGGLCIDSKSHELWWMLGKISPAPEEKESCFCHALELNSTYLKAWIDLAQLYHQHGHLELAQEALIHGRSHDASSPLIWEAMGAMEDRYERAFEYLVHSMDLNGGPSASKALLALFAKKPETLTFSPYIRNALTTCLVSYPLDPAVWNMYGLALEHDGNYHRAMFSFSVTLGLIKESDDLGKEVKLNLGRVGLKANHSQLSLQLLQGQRLPQSELLLAVAYWKNGRDQESKKSLETIVEQSDKLDVLLKALNLSMKVFVKTCNLQEAKTFLKRHHIKLKERIKTKKEALDFLECWNVLLTNTQNEDEFKSLASEMLKAGDQITLPVAAKVHVYSSPKSGKDGTLKALHWTPWNRDLHLRNNLDILHAQLSIQSSSRGQEDDSLRSQEVIESITKPNENLLEVTSLWILCLKIFSGADIEEPRKHYRVLQSRIMKQIRLHPSSIAAWFLLALLHSLTTTLTSDDAPMVDDRKRKILELTKQTISKSLGSKEVLQSLITMLEGKKV